MAKAKIEMRMTALGVEACDGCGHTIQRGREIACVVGVDDNEPRGRFCPGCIRAWLETGVMPEPKDGA